MKSAILTEYLVVLDVGGSYTTQLTAAQSDGISCVHCGAPGGPQVPVGRAYPPGPAVPRRGGVQVFACTGGCVQVFAAVAADAAGEAGR